MREVARSGAPRVVLDTNVLVSALIFGGRIARLRRAWQDGSIVPLVSAATAQELVRVLAYPKFRLDRREREDLLADYLPYAQSVRVAGRIAVPRCRDPFDVPFLELAVAGRADVIVSGDRDLLAIADRVAFDVAAPDAFIARLAQ